MREILFRGKRVDNGRWVEGQYTCEEYEPHLQKVLHIDRIAIAGACVSVGVIPETVGQYTGLTDKNGLTKIFEGDILCIKKRNGTKSRICFVCFGEYIDADSAFDNYRCIGFYIKIFDTCCTIGVLWDSEFEYEIIGNIHDNPELLEGA